MKAATKKKLSAVAPIAVLPESNGSPESALAHLRAADPVLAAVIDRVGAYAMQYHEPTFRALVRSIVFQQLHGKAARTIFDRLQKKAGGEITPDAILKLRPAQMRLVGLSKQKLTYKEMSGRQKTVFILKLIVSILSFGMLFPNLMSD